MTTIPPLPTVMTMAGLQPQPPATLLAQLLASVAAVVPGYTATLPGSLVEDVSSTDVYAVALCDSARVELVNSLTPFGANEFILNQLGQIYGVPRGAAANTSVFLVFSSPTPGFVIAKGFTVSDGQFQYVVQDGGIIGTNSQSTPLFAVSPQEGTWAVPPGTVMQFVTSVPSTVVLTVTNPQAGIPSTAIEDITDYRSAVLQAGLAASQGMSRYLKTLLGNIAGVQQRLVAVRAQTGGGWEIIVGGGDPYQVAYAIFQALFDVSTLVGSEFLLEGATQANPGVATVNLNHGYVPGQTVAIAGANPSNYNGAYSVLSVPSQTQFALGKAFPANAIVAAAWASTSGGQATASTTTPHGVSVGSTFTISGMSPAGYNGTFTALAGTAGNILVYALTPNPGVETGLGTLNAGVANVNTSGFPPYVSGGVVTPNARNVSVTIQNYPDTYIIPYVSPPQQVVTMVVTWNTNATNFVSAAAVAQLGAQPLVDYVNGVFAGQSMNLFQLQEVFQVAIASVLPAYLLTRMVFAVSINGIGVAPTAGTGIIAGDPESYFQAVLSGIDIVQG